MLHGSKQARMQRRVVLFRATIEAYVCLLLRQYEHRVNADIRPTLLFFDGSLLVK